MAPINQQQAQSNTEEDLLLHSTIMQDLHTSSSSSGLHLDSKQQWLKSIEDGLRRKDSAMIGSIDVHKNMEKMQVSTHTIYRVPRQLRDVNPYAYDPLVVTLGPYKKSRKLQPTLTENFMAISAVKILLDMQGLAAEDFTALAVKINGAVDQLSLHYERIPIYDDETLMSIFTLDAAFVACFLVYLMSSQGPATGNATPARFSGVADGHGAGTAELERRICSDLKIPKRLVSSIVRDLFLLENQIPLQLITSAMEAAVNPTTTSHQQASRSPDFAVTTGYGYGGNAVDDLLDKCIDSVVRCINPFQVDDDSSYDGRTWPSPGAVMSRGFSYNDAAAYNYNLYGSARRSFKSNGMNPTTRGRLHLLDSLYLAVTEPSNLTDGRSAPAAETPRNVIPMAAALNVEMQMQLPSAVESAVHLRRAGIIFKPSDGKTVTSVRFDSRTSTLYLPKIKLGQESEAVLRNLAAYEMVALQRAEVCSYLALMDDLIDNEEDVEVLRLSGVLVHSLRNDREVAELCNSIAKNLQVLYESDPFADAYSGIRIHLQKRMRYKRLWELYADFRARYLSAPWLTASVLAATLLLMLTITQTYYAAAIYYKA